MSRDFKGSAAAADPLVGQVPPGGEYYPLEGNFGGSKLGFGSWGFSGPGTFKKRFPGKNDVE